MTMSFIGFQPSTINVATMLMFSAEYIPDIVAPGISMGGPNRLCIDKYGLVAGFHKQEHVERTLFAMVPCSYP
jgi:hypothetical protein